MGALEQAAGAGAPMAPAMADAAAQAGAPPPGAQAGAPPPGAGAAPPPQPVQLPPTGSSGPPPPPGQMPPQKGAPKNGDPAMAIEPYLQDADPREQQEYQRAMRSVAKVLYGSDGTANAIVDQVQPNDKVGSTAKVAMLFIKELDRKINMDEAVIAEVTRETVERISELAEARHSIQYQLPEMEKVLGATWEGVQSMFGNEDVDGYTKQVQSMAPADLETLRNQQDQILANTGE